MSIRKFETYNPLELTKYLKPEISSIFMEFKNHNILNIGADYNVKLLQYFTKHNFKIDDETLLKNNEIIYKKELCNDNDKIITSFRFEKKTFSFPILSYITIDFISNNEISEFYSCDICHQNKKIYVKPNDVIITYDDDKKCYKFSKIIIIYNDGIFTS